MDMFAANSKRKKIDVIKVPLFAYFDGEISLQKKKISIHVKTEIFQQRNRKDTKNEKKNS